ncbi:MAG: crossover junction endodeoxyribonuclease RuvC [Oligoflexales bacterium]|nr:crossover junction endodeoxyribonuclease RuvC [Oligoflexales bacterium]
MSLNRILGVDPGSRIAGFALIDSSCPRPVFPRDFSVLDVGVIRFTGKESVVDRIGQLHNALYELIRELKPSICVFENVYSGKNPLSALKLGQVRGAFIAAAARCSVKAEEIASTRVKSLVTGRGHASKTEVSEALKLLMGFEQGSLPHDASDALAIALSYGLQR